MKEALTTSSGRMSSGPASSGRRGRPPLSERNIDMRAAAIEAARRICVRHDEGGFTMDRVARELGVRTPSLYHHFPGGRGELIVALADRCSRVDGEAILQIVAENDDTWTCIDQIARHFARAIDQHPYRQITELREGLPPATRHEIQAGFAERVEGPLVMLLQRAIKQNRLRAMDPEIFVRAFLVLMLNMKVFEIEEGRRNELPALLVSLLRDGVLPQPVSAG